MEYKTSDATRRASSEYRKRNKEKERLKSYQRTARMYIKKHADSKDLVEFKKLINDRYGELKKEDDNSKNK
ncbi:hypothetical protein AAK913_12500 [Enterococcus faecium]|uniref:hypothetical protein n=1 Tax=Enterococcus faecium TaxID=1352 RepID=UPI00351568A1